MTISIENLVAINQLVLKAASCIEDPYLKSLATVFDGVVKKSAIEMMNGSVGIAELDRTLNDAPGWVPERAFGEIINGIHGCRSNSLRDVDYGIVSLRLTIPKMIRELGEIDENYTKGVAGLIYSYYHVKVDYETLKAEVCFNDHRSSITIPNITRHEGHVHLSYSTRPIHVHLNSSWVHKMILSPVAKSLETRLAEYKSLL